ncbi:putative F-box/kelch-repeat protein At1g15680 [Castanea sativa]|uniref:putative F-box/kelch-repeat protein At1g15680 n=1 Tax=Castanea sativa TaxID=21020 RepID=UPI003F6523C4
MPNLLVSYEVKKNKMFSEEIYLPDFLTRSDYVSIVASSNGLLLFRLCEYDRNAYYVCSLITKEWFALPQPGIDRNIMLDGFASRLEGGVITIYKVLRCLYNGEPGENEFVTAEIYSSETGEWSSEFQVKWDRPSYRSTAKAVAACNGIVYWLSPGGGGIKAYNLYDGPTDCCNLINLPGDRDLDSVNGGLDHKACVICVKEGYGVVPYNLRTRRLEKPASHAMLGWSETLSYVLPAWPTPIPKQEV